MLKTTVTKNLSRPHMRKVLFNLYFENTIKTLVNYDQKLVFLSQQTKTI